MPREAWEGNITLWGSTALMGELQVCTGLQYCT